MPTYFAYGSNLHAPQMRERCPNAVAIGRATLHQHRLAFVGHSSGWGGGVATVQPGRGSVQGVLWELSAMDLEALDLYEGAPTHYIRRQMEVLDYLRRPVQAFVYEARSQSPTAPSERYVNQIARGMEAFGLDVTRLQDAVRRAPAPVVPQPLRDPTPGSDETVPIFVYGTLRQGGGNHARLLARAPELVTSTAPGFALYDLGAFPAMLSTNTAGRVVGEVYRVTAAELRALDRLEGVPTLYYRDAIRLTGGAEAFAYLMNVLPRGTERRIVGGDWMARHASFEASA